MTDTSVTLTVDLVALRRALSAVVPHAEPTKAGDDISGLSRVRLSAAATELHVIATNGTSAALAAVAIEEDSRKERFASDDGSFTVDIAPKPLRNILQAFKVTKPQADGQGQWCVVHITTDKLTVTDTDALMPGLSLTIPQLDFDADYPNIVKALAEVLGSAGESTMAKPLVAASKTMALWQHAATAYGQPLQFEASGPAESRGFVVLCGSQFVGAASSRHNDDDSLKKRDAERHKHMERLGLVKLKAA